MSGPKMVVYAGPTISPDEVHAVLPHAVVRPPAARGDLLAERWRRGDTAIVIDGYFRERRSVGHKEILLVVRQGVRVIGAASMGALRAVELGPYGMQGVGAVHDMYVSGEIDGDDEVGVLHGPAAMGYPARTVALVNLRYGCREGAAEGSVPADSGRRIVAAAKSLPFTFRTWPDLEARLEPADHDALRTLTARIDAGDWDLKRRDATAALHAAGEPVPAAGDAVDGLALTGIGATQQLDRQTRREYAPGRWLSDLDVLDAARLYDPDYPARHEQVLTGILGELAAARGMSLDAYANHRLGVGDGSPLPESLTAWLTPDEPRSARLVMTRVWPTWASADWRPAVIADLRTSGRWDEWSELVVRADDAMEEFRYRRPVPPPAMCANLFLRHWRLPGTSPAIEMARRGFAGPEELGAVVRRFFALDVSTARGAR
ncbi:TfuA-like protein [Actinoplanes sp. NPDC051475]|uniref:TfuA-like protein n=1 Tax=Actinoplanes sp. NPDC051475 TaxID=3157225 RepID=UPI00344DCB1F